ncbi:MAG: SHOCT domain-containing protein [Chloroflexi bacterium]|nr:SHOCT domain-containing protein [Chloroflexota bacterium]
MMFGWSIGLEAWAWMGIWILVIAVLVWFLVREPRRSGPDDAMDILRARLARGEISVEEFEHARSLLEPPRPQENPR